MADANELTLEKVAADTPLLANLLSLYLHDLSVAFPSIELGDDCRFTYANLPLYGSDPERRLAFVAKDRGRPVGFALATRGSPASQDPNVWDVAEFFVIRGAGGHAVESHYQGNPHVVRVFTFESPRTASALLAPSLLLPKSVLARSGRVQVRV